MKKEWIQGQNKGTTWIQNKYYLLRVSNIRRGIPKVPVMLKIVLAKQSLILEEFALAKVSFQMLQNIAWGFTMSSFNFRTNDQGNIPHPRSGFSSNLKQPNKCLSNSKRAPKEPLKADSNSPLQIKHLFTNIILLHETTYWLMLCWNSVM